MVAQRQLTSRLSLSNCSLQRARTSVNLRLSKLDLDMYGECLWL
jgi:hypothetical protein